MIYLFIGLINFALLFLGGLGQIGAVVLFAIVLALTLTTRKGK